MKINYKESLRIHSNDRPKNTFNLLDGFITFPIPNVSEKTISKQVLCTWVGQNVRTFSEK